MAGIKIVDLPALGRDLISTDLLELSLAGGTGSRKITGQEIMNASKLSVGNTPIINGAVGQVLFQGTGNVLQESANLFWDNTNARLGIGTSSPDYKQTIIDTSTLFTQRLRNTAATGRAGILMQNDTSAYCGFGAYGTAFTVSALQNNTTFFASHDVYFSAGDTSNTGIIYFTNGASRSNERMRVAASGNVLIGTTTDAGYKLDVNGTARVQSGFQANGIVAFGTSNGFYWDSTNQRLGIGTNTPQAFLHFNNATGEKIRMETSSSLSNFISFFKSGVRIGYFGKSGPTDDLTYFNETATGVMTFGTNSLERMRIDTSGNVGIGTSSPFGKFDVKDGEVFVTTSTNANLRSRLTYQGLYISRINDGTYTENIISTTSAWLYNSRNSHSFFRDGVGLFNVGGGFTSGGMNINTNGNVLIGTTTDAGYRLDVSGTARVSGELRVGSLQLLTSGSPGATGQGITTTSRKISFQSQGEINIDGATAYQLLGYADSPISMAQNAPGRTIGFLQVKGGFSAPNFNSTNANLVWMNPTYNMSGTSNTGQILRGIYYNPTLTDLTNATHFAFHSTSGRVRFEGLPTSPTGLNAGDIYNDGGTLKIV